MAIRIHDIESLLRAIRQGYEPSWIHFWGHRPSRDGSVSKSCLSQWWQGSPFEVEDIIYPTAEHFMMAEKARLFEDAEIAERILAAHHPREVKKLGRKIRGFDEETWERERFEIVLRGSLAKFGQNPPLRDWLLGTGEDILVEASPYDRIWGIGMDENDPRASRPEEWQGLNLLGFALMETRGRLAADGR